MVRTCNNKLGELVCVNERPHLGGEYRGGCVFQAGNYGPDLKEANEEGINGDD